MVSGKYVQNQPYVLIIYVQKVGGASSYIRVCVMMMDRESFRTADQRMRVLLTVAALVVVTAAAKVSLQDLEFHAWKQEFGKRYGSDEEESQRKMIWMENLKLVLQHNILADQGYHTYRLGMNQFGDMTNQEYQALVLTPMEVFNQTEDVGVSQFVPEEGVSVPDSIDWRAKGYVTDVKNQGGCGSCWAFSATGALEGQWFKKKGKLISLSEQQLVDCSRRFENHGCQGGWPSRAFEYIKSSGGIEADYTYTYTGQDGSCRFNPRRVQATCSGFTLVSGEANLMNAVGTVGPVTVAFDASRHTLQLYKSGVYNDPGCGQVANHAVLATGYGRLNTGQEFWLIKNSWGTGWGDAGYIKMSRNKGNQCGIASHGSYPLV